MFLQKALHRVRPLNGTSPDYVRWFLQFAVTTGALESLYTGSTIRHLPGRQLARVVVPMPASGEQRRIVARLDEIDERRVVIKDRLAAATALLERVRGAVLAAQFPELERETQMAQLESVLREPLKNGYSARPVSHVTSTRVLTLSATTSGSFDPEHFKYTDDKIPADSPLWLEPGDVLVQRGNTAELVGMPALYDGAPGEFIYPDLMIRARVSDDVDPRYVWYMLLAPQSRRFLRDRAIGTAGNMPKINQKAANAVPIPLPSEEGQAHVIGRLSAALSITDRMVQAISAAETGLERACRAALARAFRGELVATDAALIIGTDEPSQPDPDRSAIASP